MSKKINMACNNKNLIISIVLVLFTLAVYWQVNHYNFVILDDVFYVTSNNYVQSGISIDSVCWAFSTKYFGLWNPLVWLSLMVDYEIFGLNAGGYHLTNLILHILSTLLLFWLFHRMTGALWKSAYVAAFFALHPMHVESVVWISERKDVLSAFFWMLTLLCYVYYTEKPFTRRYLLVLFCFILALLSKPMVITLPVIMILLDYWPLKRFESVKGNLLLWQLKEKMAFLILSVIFIIIIFYNSNASNVQTIENFKQFSLFSRLANAPVAFVTYLIKTFWPHDMAVLYPFTEDIPLWHVTGTSLLILVISGFVIIKMKRRPYLFVGWLWFVISIAPVIGIVQISYIVPYAMADRYHYLPSIGLSIMLAWGIPFLFQRENRRIQVQLVTGFAMTVILAFLTWKQCGYWENSRKLFNHTSLVTKNNYLAHDYLGIALFHEGETKKAIFHYDKAILIKPDYSGAYLKRGNAYAKLSEYQLAINDYKKAIYLKPDYVEAYINSGLVYGQQGHYLLALENYNEAINLRPDNAEAYHKRGAQYARLGQHRRAIDDYNKAIHSSPDYADPYIERGIAYGELGDYHLAIEDFNTAIRLKPDNAEAYNNRGFTYFKLGQNRLAIDDYNEAIRLKPDYAVAYMNRGILNILKGNKTLGCRDVQKACELGNCRILDNANIKKVCR